MTKTQAARVRQLIRALRSGKFKQCRNRLSSAKGGRFCASGVACELYARAMRGSDGQWILAEDDVDGFPDGFPGHRSFRAGNQVNDFKQPYLVRQWFGFPTDTEFFIPAGLVRQWRLDTAVDVEFVSLEHLNDGVKASAAFARNHCGLTFPKIAGILERWLKQQKVTD